MQNLNVVCGVCVCACVCVVCMSQVLLEESASHLDFSFRYELVLQFRQLQEQVPQTLGPVVLGQVQIHTGSAGTLSLLSALSLSPLHLTMPLELKSKKEPTLPLLLQPTLYLLLPR